MKKFLLPLVAMLFCMTACNKDNEGILKLEVEQYTSNAKVHLDDDYAVWDDEDAVWVNGTTYEVSVDQVNHTATLTGVPSATSYTAIYPYDWAGGTISAPTVTYPAEQTYRANGIDAPMAAFSDGGTLKFSNLGSILAVTVSGVESVKKIEVVADGTTAINGTAAIDFSGDRPSLGTLSGGSTTTTLNCNNVTVPTTGMTFYIALPPVSANLTIKVYDDYFCYSRSQSHDTPPTYEANHGYNVPFASSDATPEQYAPMSNQIFYTAPSQLGLTTKLTNAYSVSSHSFDAGKGVITFSTDITSIPNSAFQGKNLTSITLPSSVTTIGERAFESCTALGSINLSHISTLGKNAFYGCNNLVSVDIPLVTTILNGTFGNCNNLTSINMPSVTTIASSVFNGCSSLTSIDLPSVTSIAQGAFRNCSSLSTVNLYQDLTSLGTTPFANCAIGTLNWHISSIPTISPTSINFGTAFSGTVLHVLSGATVSDWMTWRGTYFQGGVIADL